MSNDNGCNSTLLKTPLSLDDLIANGTSFEVDNSFEGEDIPSNLLDELNIDSDDEDIQVEHSKLVSPWTKSFEELKMQMNQVNEHIWKKIVHVGSKANGCVTDNCRVSIKYNAYWEFEGTPFDSSYLRGHSYSFYTGQFEVLEGLEAAVCTMHQGEISQFIISYQLLFHELGCPPRVKPKADGLFIIELIAFESVGDVNADKKLNAEHDKSFFAVLSTVKQIHLKGLDYFKQQNYRNAIKAFEKAVNWLSYCHISNDDEEEEQRKLLVKLHTNLAVCYLKIKQPNKTCIVAKEIRRLTNNEPSCKAIFQEGRALFMLGDYKRAQRELASALKIEPNNMEIISEMKMLQERMEQNKVVERSIWSKALGLQETTLLQN